MLCWTLESINCFCKSLQIGDSRLKDKNIIPPTFWWFKKLTTKCNIIYTDKTSVPHRQRPPQALETPGGLTNRPRHLPLWFSRQQRRQQALTSPVASQTSTTPSTAPSGRNFRAKKRRRWTRPGLNSDGCPARNWIQLACGIWHYRRIRCLQMH